MSCLFLTFLFADDSILFVDVDLGQGAILKEVLDCYSLASGQRVNYEKSEMSFGSKVNDERLVELAGFFGIRVVECHDKYLGLPIFVVRCKKDPFQFIKYQVWNKVRG